MRHWQTLIEIHRRRRRRSISVQLRFVNCIVFLQLAVAVPKHNRKLPTLKATIALRCRRRHQHQNHLSELYTAILVLHLPPRTADKLTVIENSKGMFEILDTKRYRRGP